MTDDRIRVLQVIANLDRGGGQEVVRTLVRHLPQAGCDPVVVSLADGPLRAEIEALGVPVEIVAGRTRSLTSGPAALGELRRIRRDLAAVVARHRPDVIQTHLLRSLDFLALTLRREPGVRAVFWTVHNAMLDLRADQLPGSQRWLLGPKRLAHRTLYRAGGRWADGFIAVSSDVADTVRAAYRPPPGRLAVIPNGVDIERYAREVDRDAVRASVGVAADAPLAIVVAKLMTQKGHAVLLDALPGVLERVQALRVVLVGEGELRVAIEERVSGAGLEDSVTFAGNRGDIPQLLAASDVFVLPSLWEGLPMALLEAMASGLPVVATAVSGTREVVEAGRSGILVPPGDAAALGTALIDVLERPELAASLGAAARSRVEDCYSARAQAKRHAELYRSRLASISGGET